MSEELIDPKDCKHNVLRVGFNIIRVIANEDTGLADPPVRQHILEASPQCIACGLPFVVDWEDIADPNLPPLYTESRPWVTPNRDTICVKIKPINQEASDIPDPITWSHPETSGKPN